MSSTFQAVQRSESFTGLGYFPDFTPAQNAERLIGKIVSTWGRRRKPVSANDLLIFIESSRILLVREAVLLGWRIKIRPIINFISEPSYSCSNIQEYVARK